MEQHRRSPRVLARIPVKVRVGEGPPLPALTAVVNRHGALLLSLAFYGEGTVLWLQNEFSDDAAYCSVVWVGPLDPSGAHKLGVEFVDEVPEFWGDVYEKLLASAPQH
jgi:hypothetical protein